MTVFSGCQNLSVLVLLVILLFPGSTFALSIVADWEVYSNPGVPVLAEKSHDVVRGEYRAIIDPPLRPFTNQTQLDKITDYNFGWLDYYHLIQTINAKHYRGRHLHISGYIKLDQRVVKQHIGNYKAWMEEKIARQDAAFEADEEVLQPFYASQRDFKRYDHLPAASELAMFVYIHTEKNIYRYRATSESVLNSHDWQRLNVEADLPKSATAVTVSLYFKGVGQLYLDHLAVVEQGKALKGSGQRISKKHQGKIWGKLRGWEKKYNKRTRFKNLSFEQFRREN